MEDPKIEKHSKAPCSCIEYAHGPLLGVPKHSVGPMPMNIP